MVSSDKCLRFNLAIALHVSLLGVEGGRVTCLKRQHLLLWPYCHFTFTVGTKTETGLCVLLVDRWNIISFFLCENISLVVQYRVEYSFLTLFFFSPFLSFFFWLRCFRYILVSIL